MEYEDDYHPETVHFSTKDAHTFEIFAKKHIKKQKELLKRRLNPFCFFMCFFFKEKCGFNQLQINFLVIKLNESLCATELMVSSRYLIIIILVYLQASVFYPVFYHICHGFE